MLHKYLKYVYLDMEPVSIFEVDSVSQHMLLALHAKVEHHLSELGHES